MGVRTNLLASAPTAGTITQAETIGIDIPGNLAGLELKCQEMITLMKALQTEVTTPSGDSTFGTILSTAVTALS